MYFGEIIFIDTIYKRIGNGLSVSSINAAILTSAPRKHAGVASGMLATMRNFGQTLGVASSSVILTYRQLVYSKNTSLSAKDIYLFAQRDTYYFGIFILIVAFVFVFLLPRTITERKLTMKN